MSNEHFGYAAPEGRRRAVQAINNEQLRVRARKTCLSLYTKVMQPMKHFCIKRVACKDTSAKRYKSQQLAISTVKLFIAKMDK